MKAWMEGLTDTEVRHLKMVRRYALKVARPETACNSEAYIKYHKQHSRLMGHCAAMASTIKGILGGDIVSGRIYDVDGTWAGHYWNRLPSGKEVDLTSCQFGGDGFTPLKKGRKIAHQPKLVNPRYLLFAQRILMELHK